MTAARRRRRLRDDSRGLGIAIVVFAAMLVIGAFLLTLVYIEGYTPMADAALSSAETQQGADQINTAKSIAAAMGIYVVALASMFLLSRSVLESRGPG